MASAIGLKGVDSDTVRMAGLLHDVCHPPFSHAMESLMEQTTGLDHMELARRLIKGTIPNHSDEDEDILGGMPSIAEMMEDHGISSDKVCDLIAFPEPTVRGLDSFSEKMDYFPSDAFMHQIIHGPVDADQMDYLMRDAHYTGITHGTIDAERLINTMRVRNDRIVIRRGGVTAAEGLMVSRSLMYTTVYFHETVRIAQRMLYKAVSESGLQFKDIYLLNDSQLISRICESGGRSSKTVRELTNRKINKKAFAIYSADMNEDLADRILDYADPKGWTRLENEIASASGLDSYDICVETTSKNNLNGNINIGKTEVAIEDDGGKIRYLTRFSPIARALQSRDPFGWALLVSAPSDKCDEVGRATRKVLGL